MSLSLKKNEKTHALTAKRWSNAEFLRHKEMMQQRTSHWDWLVGKDGGWQRDSLSLCSSAKNQFWGMLARWSFVCVALRIVSTLVMSHKSNSGELVGFLCFTDIYSRSRSSEAFETRKTGFPPFVNSKTVDSWWISALFDLKLLNMLNILF